MPLFGPLVDGMIVPAYLLPQLVRQTALNANRAVRYNQAGFNRPYPTRKKYIDEIVTYNTEADLLNILTENTIGIDVRILGVEYKDKDYTGRDLPLPVYYNTRDHGFSTTELRGRVYEAEKAKREEK